VGVNVQGGEGGIREVEKDYEGIFIHSRRGGEENSTRGEAWRIGE
jgi:hypothetical protein